MDPADLPQILTPREYGHDELRARARGGQIERLRHGAYTSPLPTGPRWKANRSRLRARCVAVSKRLTGLYAFSHDTAAHLFGWAAPIDPQAVQIVQATKPSSTRQRDIRRHCRPNLAHNDIVEVAGLPVLREEQTIIDCSRNMHPMHALMTVDSALKSLADVDRRFREDSLGRQAVLLDRLTTMLADVGPGRHVARAREVLRYANGLSGSPQESKLRWLALSIGLPEPVIEWEQLVDGLRYFSDLAWFACAADWPVRAITFEYDGGAKYGTDVAAVVQSLEDEKVREDTIESTDVAVHRVMKGRMSDLARTALWMLSKFPPSTRASLTPRPLLQGPVIHGR